MVNLMEKDQKEVKNTGLKTKNISYTSFEYLE